MNDKAEEPSLILNKSHRYKTRSDLQNIIDDLIAVSSQSLNQKNFVKDFIVAQFDRECIINASGILKNKLIPLDDPEINRFFQTSIIMYMSILSHEHGFDKINIIDAFNKCWDICSSYYDYFNVGQKFPIKFLYNYLSKYGEVKNKYLILNSPIIIDRIIQPNTDYQKKYNDLYEKIKSLITMPEPTFLYNKLNCYEKMLCSLQNVIQSSKGTEFVYTRGRGNRLIYKRIEEMILISEKCFRIMMAYLSDEVKILYSLIDKLKLDNKYTVKMIVRSDDSYSNQNAAAIMDLKNMIIKKAKDDENKDDMLERLKVKYFKADPNLYHRLHAKLLICDEKSVLAGSANLIPTSLESNIEVGFFSEDHNLVHEGIDFFEDVWNQC